MKKACLTLMIVCVLTLAACQGTDQQPEAAVPGGEAGDTHSEEFNAETPSTPSSNSLSDRTERVKEKEYPSKTEAVNAVEAYHKVEQSNIDLGHGIQGFAEGAAGHQYISWNEGKWLIEVNFPSDPEYAVDTYDSAESMAKSIVGYLEDHYLPPPDERGTIHINGFREHPETVVQWQVGSKVYTIEQPTSDPLEALEIAVDYEANDG